MKRTAGVVAALVMTVFWAIPSQSSSAAPGSGATGPLHSMPTLERAQQIKGNKPTSNLTYHGGPVETAPAVYIDPTHRTAFSIDTFAFFIADGTRSYYFDFHFSRIGSRRIVFHRYRAQPWNYLVEPAVNARPGIQTWYEETFLSRLFPAANVRVTLVK